MRVAVLIVRAAADDGVLRLRLVQQAVARGGMAAVVAGLDDVAADVFARVEHVRLALVLGVAGEEEGVAAVVHAQDEALVVDVAVVLLRAEDGHGRAAEGERIAHVRHSDGEVCRLGCAHDALLQSGLINAVCGEIKNLFSVYEAIEYTESTKRALAQIIKALPKYQEQLDAVVKKYGKPSTK